MQDYYFSCKIRVYGETEEDARNKLYEMEGIEDIY